MKKNAIFLMAALVATVIIGAHTGNNESHPYVPETIEAETELCENK